MAKGAERELRKKLWRACKLYSVTSSAWANDHDVALPQVVKLLNGFVLNRLVSSVGEEIYKLFEDG
nr:Hypothetical protein SC2p1_01150 [Methylocystis sp. SC2]